MLWEYSYLKGVDSEAIYLIPKRVETLKYEELIDYLVNIMTATIARWLLNLKVYI